MLPFFRGAQRADTSSVRRFDGKRERCLRPVRLQLETLEDRVVPSTTINLPLVNDTGLNPAQYSIYVFGYGQANTVTSLPATELLSNGQFVPLAPNSSGTLQSYNLSTMPSITLNSTNPVNSGILYFVVVPNGQASPTLSYSTDGNDVVTISGLPGNPPNNNPPFAFVELTEPADDTNYPTIDVSAVNGFAFPITMTLNDNLGQVGQTLSNPAVNRASILAAYTTFMNNQGAAGVPYQSLEYAPNSIAGQAGGIVNPTLYLASGAGGPLASVWNNSLTTLFGTTAGGGGMTLSLIGTDNGYYKGTPQNLTIGSSTYRVLHFVGYSHQAGNPPAPNGNTFNIFSPLTPDPNGSSYNPSESPGQMVFGGDNVFNDSSTTVLNGSTGPSPTTVALNLENQINAALNRGVALLGPTDGLNGDDSIYWGTETNWYPAGQTENLYSLFVHTGTVSGTPIFTLPPNPANDAQGTPMSQAYGFAFDEQPGTPSDQPNVPSKIEPLPPGSTTAAITLGPWFAPTPSPAPPSPTPSPSPSPSASVSPLQSWNGLALWLALIEDQDAAMVDSLISKVDATYLQTANAWFALCNDHFGLNNPVLGQGLESLESAIRANPYNGTIWGMAAEAAGLELATTQLADSFATQLHS